MGYCQHLSTESTIANHFRQSARTRPFNAVSGRAIVILRRGASLDGGGMRPTILTGGGGMIKHSLEQTSLGIASPDCASAI
jgi:hypothetical protein